MSKIASATIGVLMSFALLAMPVPRASSSVKVLKISEKNAGLLDKLESYPDLESLSIKCVAALKVRPDSIGKLTRLRELIIDNGNGCAMNPVLPESIGNLYSLEKLVLYGAQDPSSVGDEPNPQPHQRHKFPGAMSQLKNLVYLDLGRNGLTEIPSFVGDLPKLGELRFQFNALKELSPVVARLQELRVLELNGNDLSDLPGFLKTLPNLTRVTLGNNCRITQSPAKVTELTNRFPNIHFDFMDEYDCPAN
ncbi:MAG: leucine-rich repeat domain-containing protein [Candidatus Acidiferrales bacterium]